MQFKRIVWNTAIAMTMLFVFAACSNENHQNQDTETQDVLDENPAEDFGFKETFNWDKNQLERDATYTESGEIKYSYKVFKEDPPITMTAELKKPNEVSPTKTKYKERPSNTPKRLEEPEIEVESNSAEVPQANINEAAILDDISFNRPPLFDNACLTAENPEDCSNDAVQAWMREHLDYPSPALEEGHDGYEYATFTVRPNGQVFWSDIEVKSKDKPCDGCKQAVKAAIAQMPDWLPALRNGKAVSSEVALPVKFLYIGQ